jgi:nucleotide-binding universal stress UspA family protein
MESKIITGDPNMFPIRKILFSTDFSDHSRAAFEVACALARDYKAELHIVHVNRPSAIFAPDGIAIPVPAEEPYDLRITLAQIRPTDPSVSVDHHMLEGNPADEILKMARVKGFDLIVMGTHGSTGLTRLLMGSVAESVLRKAPCPVLTIRNLVSVGDKAAKAVEAMV